MLTTPLDVLPGVAELALPGCLFSYGLNEDGNVVADKLKLGDTLFFVDDEMTVAMEVTRNGRLLVTYTVAILLVTPSKLSDAPPVRWPRVRTMINATAKLLMELRKQATVESVTQRNIRTIYNETDRNVDGVAVLLDLVLKDTYTYC